MNKDKIQRIRDLLDELEIEAPTDTEKDYLIDFSALEFPSILQNAVDYLFPQITPYDATYYIYLLRISLLQKGDQYVRLSTRRLQSGIIEPTYGKGTKVALGTIQKILKSLETIGAIRKEGDTTREGTLYKVLLPEEIASCREAMEHASKQNFEDKTINIEKEVDYYNIKENRVRIYERDNYQCGYCGIQLTRFSVTLDHKKPVAEGGDNSLTNLITACLNCNSKKNKKPLGDFLADR